jgi:flagellar biogenesis protein FliO
MESNLWEALIRIIVCLPIVWILTYAFMKFEMKENYSGLVLPPKATYNIVLVGNEYLFLRATEKEMNLIKQFNNYQNNETAKIQSRLADAVNIINKANISA